MKGVYNNSMNAHLITSYCLSPSPRLIGEVCGWRQTETRYLKEGETISADDTVTRHCLACGAPFTMKVLIKGSRSEAGMAAPSTVRAAVSS